jgi:hypothetical protein
MEVVYLDHWAVPWLKQGPSNGPIWVGSALQHPYTKLMVETNSVPETFCTLNVPQTAGTVQHCIHIMNRPLSQAFKETSLQCSGTCLHLQSWNWRWKQQVIPKCWYPWLHSVTYQKTVLLESILLSSEWFCFSLSLNGFLTGVVGPENNRTGLLLLPQLLA